MAMIVVGGAIANKPRSGGAAWTRLSWILGLRRLGFRVVFVEQIRRRDCLDAGGAPVPFAESVNLAFFRQVTERFGLADGSALILDEGEEVYGLPLTVLAEVAREAVLLVNITGHLTLGLLRGRARLEAYLDLDPGYTQYWHASGDLGARLLGHDFYFTIGENIGAEGCPIPTGGLRWRAIRQPVVLDEWPASAGEGGPEGFTTVATWRGPYGPVSHLGRTFGLKAHEFRKFVGLPGRTGRSFEIALDIHRSEVKDLELLRGHGWTVVDPSAVVPDPDAFRRYVQGSWAEFSVAQGIYVETQGGWFSDRTVRYLATGKPALVQDTGVGRNYPVGAGLLTFRTLEEAIEGVARIAADYAGHCRAARALAETYFDSDRVLGRFLGEMGID